MTETIIEIAGLTKYFGTSNAIYELSFSIEKGEVFALLGPNGAGKSTLMKMLLGFIPPTRGYATVFGSDSQKLSPEIREKIGYLSEGHRLYEWMRIRDLENFTAGSHPRWSSKDFNHFMDYFALDKKQKIGTLSNGQRAQVSMSLALACDPELLIMDDPTLGLDAGTRLEFLRCIVDLASIEGRTILFSTHILGDVERVADRIGIIQNGKLRTNTTLDNFKSSVIRYHLRFENEIPKELSIPRILSRTELYNEAFLTVAHPGPDTVDAFNQCGALSFEPIEITLEEAFVDYTAGKERNISFIPKVSS